jgi:hypothetical protein
MLENGRSPQGHRPRLRQNVNSGVLAVVAVCSLFSTRAREVLVEASEILLGGELWAAWGVAMLGSLYFLEVAALMLLALSRTRTAPTGPAHP